METSKLFALEYRGWRRSSDDGKIHGFERDRPDRIEASFYVRPGIRARAPHETPVRELGALRLRGDVRGTPLSVLSPVQFSELVRDLALLVG